MVVDWKEESGKQKTRHEDDYDVRTAGMALLEAEEGKGWI